MAKISASSKIVRSCTTTPAARSALASATGARLAWIPRRAGERGALEPAFVYVVSVFAWQPPTALVESLSDLLDGVRP